MDTDNDPLARPLSLSLSLIHFPTPPPFALCPAPTRSTSCRGRCRLRGPSQVCVVKMMMENARQLVCVREKCEGTCTTWPLLHTLHSKEGRGRDASFSSFPSSFIHSSPPRSGPKELHTQPDHHHHTHPHCPPHHWERARLRSGVNSSSLRIIWAGAAGAGGGGGGTTTAPAAPTPTPTP